MPARRVGAAQDRGRRAVITIALSGVLMGASPKAWPRAAAPIFDRQRMVYLGILFVL